MPLCDRNKPDWLRMIRSALKTLDYFEDHLDELVTDAAVGTRIMEGMCSVQYNVPIWSKFRVFIYPFLSTTKYSAEGRA